MKQKETVRKIHRAFWELQTGHPGERITVRRLTEKARIVRSTFYTYYDNLTQLKIDIENEFNHRVRDLLEPYCANIQTFADPLMIHALLAHLADSYAQFQFLCKQNGGRDFLEKFSNTVKTIFCKRLDLLKLPYNEMRVSFAVYGMVALLGYLQSGKTVDDLTEESVKTLTGIFTN